MVDVSNLKKSFGYAFSRLFTPLSALIFLCCWSLASLTGPFGTIDVMPLGLRSAYFFVIVVGAYLFGYTVFSLVLAVFGLDRRLLSCLLSAVVMTIVFAPYVILMRSVFGAMAGGIDVTPWSICLNIFSFSLSIFLIRSHIIDDRSLIEGTEDTQDVPRLHRRLTKEVRGAVLRLEAQDHLTLVVTAQGTATIRIRFTDAVAEMDPTPGLCVHRSHWVSEAAIERIERDGPGKLLLHLANGDTVPVSRKYRPDLEQRGYGMA